MTAEEVSTITSEFSEDEDNEILSDDLTDELECPELFFAVVGAIGTNLDKVFVLLKKSMNDEFGYKTEEIKITDFICSEADKAESDRYQRYLRKMQAGTEIRERYKRPDTAILKALNGVRACRRKLNSNLALKEKEDPAEVPVDQVAYVFNSLKRPEEVDTLRRIYGKSFFLIGAYSPRESRVVTLAERIAESRNKQNSEEFRTEAEELIEKDRADHGHELGQAVQKTFPESDIFVNVDEEEKAEKELERFVRLVFGNAFYTPSRYEQAMFFAKAAALRSADLGRQVGAVIVSPEGEILSTGTNEVPKAKGGQYWEGDPDEKRDFRLKYDSNDKMKQRLIGDISAKLEKEIHSAFRNMAEKLKREDVSDGQIQQLINETITKSSLSQHISKSQMTNLIAYFRAVHAEMAAITNAAYRGIAVKGCTLVCTTFPCHECARHIISAGISNVIFAEPYAKSLTTELYRDSVVVDSPATKDSFVHFSPFVGVAPRQFMNLFDASRIERKKNGELLEWDSATSKPRQSESPQAYIFKETRRLHFLEAFEGKLNREKEQQNAGQ